MTNNLNVLLSYGIGFLFIVLVTEGVKSIFKLFGKPLHGKAAFWTFTGIFFISTGRGIWWNATSATPGDLWYLFNLLLNFCAAIGTYNFISRLYIALSKNK